MAQRPIETNISGLKLVTASDATNDPNGPFAGILIDAAGAVKFTDCNNNDVALANLAVGVVHPIPIKRVWTTGTADATKVFGAVPGSHV